MSKKSWETYEPTERLPRPIPLIEFDTFERDHAIYRRAIRWRRIAVALQIMAALCLIFGLARIFVTGQLGYGIFVVALGVILGLVGDRLGEMK